MTVEKNIIELELIDALKLVQEMKNDRAMANRCGAFLQTVAQALVGRTIEFVRGAVQRVRADVLECEQGSWKVRMKNVETGSEYLVNITTIKIDYISERIEEAA